MEPEHTLQVITHESNLNVEFEKRAEIHGF